MDVPSPPLRAAVIVVAVLGVSSAVVLAGSHHGGPQAARPGRPATFWANPVTFWDDTEHEDPHNDGANAAPGADLDPPGAANGDTTPDRCRAGAGRDPGRDRRRAANQRPGAGGSDCLPAVPTADRGDPGAYAIAFATELLDTNYAVQSRAALLAWAEHEEAPNTLPGVPATVAGKALVLSLADPDLPGGSPSPTPSAASGSPTQRLA